MADPLPENLTTRAWIDYSTPGGDHSLMIRFQAGASAEFVAAQLQVLANLLPPLWPNSVSTTGFRWSQANTNFSLPLPGTAVTGTAVGSLGAIEYPRFISFVGRSFGGRRVRYYLYGCLFAEEGDYRLEATDFPAADTVRSWLDDPNNFLVGIDGEATTLNPYINWGFNAYYQRRARTIS